MTVDGVVHSPSRNGKDKGNINTLIFSDEITKIKGKEFLCLFVFFSDRDPLKERKSESVFVVCMPQTKVGGCRS